MDKEIRYFYKVCHLHDILGSGTCIISEEDYQRIINSEMKPFEVEFFNDKEERESFVYEEGVKEFIEELGFERYDQYTIANVTGYSVENLPTYPFWGCGNNALMPILMNALNRYGYSNNKSEHQKPDAQL